MIKAIFTKNGAGEPAVAIVGCLHGDEIIGKKVIQALQNINLKSGSITFILAHPEAIKRKKRFINKDLNRSFPGKRNGVVEERIAFDLTSHLKKLDLVIDIHATNSDFRDLAIVVAFGKKEKELLKLVPIAKIALIKKSVFGGNEMISYCKLGVSLEYGPDKTGKNAPLAVRHVKTILRNLGMLTGKSTHFYKKELYTVSRSYTVPKIFLPNNKLKNFIAIKRGQVIGKVKNKIILSNKTFYPIFLGKGRYKKTLALVSKKKEIQL
ncbi:MAG: succinylglutamate desuccinylase/aspartoacylase family protein [bacterium]|nr:succinylglutamate desuccinylase/aspartoacylase family protein [bacterium]